MKRDGRVTAKIGAVAGLIVLAEILIADGDGAVVGGFAGAWIATLYLARPAIRRDRSARLAIMAAVGMAFMLVDDPNVLAWGLFWTALSLAALLTRHGFDDALAWSRRLGWHAISAIIAPVRDAAGLSAIRLRRGAPPGGIRAVATLVALPFAGSAVFLALFAYANPLIGQAFARIVVPSPWTIGWRSLFGIVVLITTWASFRPSPRTTRWPHIGAHGTPVAFEPGVATLTLSLITFNAIFAIENILDVVFLWSGASLPTGVTMATYAHRGAYSLIVTALLAGVFVLLALRPGSAAAASSLVRRLVTIWLVQTLLLVASSVLRTLDYVDAHGMTVLRLSALAWMGLVGTGLGLIGWRLLAGKSAAWLINANALAAMTVLATASIVDLGATAAAWNVSTAVARGKSGPPLDLCYMVRLGPSSLVSLAVLEQRTREPALRDRLSYLRWQTHNETAGAQADWRRWTPRNARRLASVRAVVGTAAPHVRPAPYGRDCDGQIQPPPPWVSAPASSAPMPSTAAVRTPASSNPALPPSSPKTLTPSPQR